MTKQCTRCGRFLSADQFWANARKADGLQTFCKNCANLHHRERIVAEWQLPKFTGRGPCRDEHPELFFLPGDNAIAAAKNVCRRCPVRGECLNWALRNPEAGIWGGLTEEERKPLMRGRVA